MKPHIHYNNCHFTVSLKEYDTSVRQFQILFMKDGFPRTRELNIATLSLKILHPLPSVQ